MTMKSSDSAPAELESELIRLNALIRARRRQLDFLARCPNTDCECRAVWREVTEKKLAGQVSKVRKQVRTSHNGHSAKRKNTSSKSR